MLGDIHGRVVDTQGLPVPGARVLLERRRRLVADADASGRFELRGLEPDDYLLTVLPEGLPDGFAPRRHRGQPHPTAVEIPKTGGFVEVVLEVAEVAAVSGRVLGPDGEPGRAFAVRVVSFGPPRLATVGATDGEGRFRIEGLWPGPCEVDAWGRGAPETQGLPQPRRLIQLAPGEELDLGDVFFERGPCTLLGRVIDQDGRPVEGIAIVCEGGATTGTRADGSFLFEGLFPRRYAVSVGPSGYAGYRRIFARDHSWLTLPADFAGGRTMLDLGEIQLVRDRLFEVRGRIEADPKLYPLNELRVRVEGLPSRWDAVYATLDRSSGTFEYWFDPRDGPRELTLIVSSRSDDVARVPVRAVADQRVDLVIPVR